MDTPQVDDLIIFLGQMAGAVIAIVAVVTIISKWLLKDVKEELCDIKKELHPNGGGSMRDAINRLEYNQSQFAKDIAEASSDIKDIRNKVDDHINWHLDQD